MYLFYILKLNHKNSLTSRYKIKNCWLKITSDCWLNSYYWKTRVNRVYAIPEICLRLTNWTVRRFFVLCEKKTVSVSRIFWGSCDELLCMRFLKEFRHTNTFKGIKLKKIFSSINQRYILIIAPLFSCCQIVFKMR